MQIFALLFGARDGDTFIKFESYNFKKIFCFDVTDLFYLDLSQLFMAF